MRALQSRSSAGREYILLAPPQIEEHRSFRNFAVDEELHSAYMAAMQKLRGQIYLADGAIDASQLWPTGRHCLPADRQSWHLLLLDGRSLVGCMRYRPYWDAHQCLSLGVLRCTLARSEEWGSTLRAAVDGDVELACNDGIAYGEAGGWALSGSVRHSAEALRMVLATYSLAQLLGNGIVFSTATMRNESATILKRIGGRPLTAGETELPPYFDPDHGCEMQVLRFDSRMPNPKYSEWVHELRRNISTCPVVCSQLVEGYQTPLEAQPAFA